MPLRHEVLVPPRRYADPGLNPSQSRAMKRVWVFVIAAVAPSLIVVRIDLDGVLGVRDDQGRATRGAHLRPRGDSSLTPTS